ncbi:MAG: hypothetical protein LBK25_02450 [Treponema sp.]|nr:hypothetical protein [Treponema sp.]
MSTTLRRQACLNTSQRVLFERGRRCPRLDGTTLVNKRGSCSVLVGGRRDTLRVSDIFPMGVV